MRGVPRCSAARKQAEASARCAQPPVMFCEVSRDQAIACFPDVTPHTLRHSFASLAGDLGYSETTIAALVGHKGRSITSRYVHSADAVLLAAADAVADRTIQLMRGVVVQLRPAAG